MRCISTGRAGGVLLTALLLGAATAAAGVNKSVRIGAGAQADGATSVNGNVYVGAGATLSGSVRTVNGKIAVEENAAIQDAETVNGSLRVASGVQSATLSTVNGSIRIDDNVTVDGDVTAVNGRIGIDKGSRVAGNVSNVNGKIHVDGADLGGNLETVSGDVMLENGSILRGDLIVARPSGWNRTQRRKPEIVIGPGSQVIGTIRVEQEVDLYISESAEVGGVQGVMAITDAVRFSGKRP